MTKTEYVTAENGLRDLAATLLEYLPRHEIAELLRKQANRIMDGVEDSIAYLDAASEAFQRVAEEQLGEASDPMLVLLGSVHVTLDLLRKQMSPDRRVEFIHHIAQAEAFQSGKSPDEIAEWLRTQADDVENEVGGEQVH